MLKTRIVASLAGLGLIAALAGATVSPSAGTIGTEFSVTFDGDVGTKPKIELRYLEPTKKAKQPKAKAKLVSSDGMNVTFVIQAAKGGGPFQVGAKGSDATAGTLTLAAPRIDSLGAAVVEAGGELTIQGQYFGELDNRRNAPKVFVNGKKAKVTSFSDTALTISVHKRTKPGAAAVAVANKVGGDTLEGNLTVTVPPKPIKGADALFGKFGKDTLKVKFTKKTPQAVIATFGGILRTLQISAVNAKASRKSIRAQQLTILFDAGVTDLSNLTLPAVFTNVGLVTYSDSLTKLSGFPPTPGTPVTSAYDNDGGATPFTVTITNVAGDRISGTFSGSLVLGAGTGPATIDVPKGKFVATISN